MRYERIPKAEHAAIIGYVATHNYKKLLEIHNKYKLTDWNYDCCGLDGLLDWYKHGIENGQIKAD